MLVVPANQAEPLPAEDQSRPRCRGLQEHQALIASRIGFQDWPGCDVHPEFANLRLVRGRAIPCQSLQESLGHRAWRAVSRSLPALPGRHHPPGLEGWAPSALATLQRTSWSAQQRSRPTRVKRLREQGWFESTLVLGRCWELQSVSSGLGSARYQGRWQQGGAAPRRGSSRQEGNLRRPLCSQNSLLHMPGPPWGQFNIFNKFSFQEYSKTSSCNPGISWAGMLKRWRRPARRRHFFYNRGFHMICLAKLIFYGAFTVCESLFVVAQICLLPLR